MDSFKPKFPPSQDSATRRASPYSTPCEAHTISGHVIFDDRGQAVWEWNGADRGTTTSSADTRLQKHSAVGLSLTDPDPRASRRIPENPTGTRKGYDPYESGRLNRALKEKPVRKDLRKLGEWIRLKQQAERNKREE